MSIKKFLLFACVFLVCATASSALEYRKPDEVTRLVLISTYPAEILVSISTEGKTLVWYDYDTMQVRDGKNVTFPGFENQRYKMFPKQIEDVVGYTAKKYQVFEGTKTVYETTELANIPVCPEWTFEKNEYTRLFGNLSCIGSVGCTSLEFEDMKAIGFKDDKVVVDIPGCGFSYAHAIWMDGKGYLYADGEGGCAIHDTPVLVAVKLNRDGKVVDEFVYEKSKYKERDFARYPWVWGELELSDVGPTYVDEKGGLYLLQWVLNEPALKKKVIIKRWQTK